MAHLRKNIWIIYLLFLIGSSVLAGIIAQVRWQGIVADQEMLHIHRAEQVSSAVHAVLVSQEMMLDVLGQQLLKLDTEVEQVRSPRLLDELLQVNPSLVGFGLARPDGQLMLVDSGQKRALLPNLLQQPESRDSFRQTLTEPGMVLGRTYFQQAIGDWLIPIRKALRNDQGEVVAVMTAGINILGSSRLLHKDLHYSATDEVSLVRAADHYLQYHSSEVNQPEQRYMQPLNPARLQAAFQALEKATGRSLQDIRQLQQATAYIRAEPQGKRIEAAVYEPRYRLWVMSSVSMDEVVAQFIPLLTTYAVIFILVQGLVFLLFRSIARAEQRTLEKLEYQASHDPLTRLPNRQFLIERTDALTRGSREFSLLFIDVDNFKGINDNFGHDYGDQLLIQMGQKLQRQLEPSDILVRLGGDEFVVVTFISDEMSLQHKAFKLLALVSDGYWVHGLQFHTGASIGIARFPEHGRNLNELLRAADVAMHKAKQEKNSVELYRREVNDVYLRNYRIEQLLRGAVSQNELYMQYQPQVDRRGHLIGVEALLRWQSPEMGFIPPDQFIAIAESSGLMPLLGEFVINRTLQEMRSLQDQLGQSFSVAINISVRQLMQANFVSLLAQQVTAGGFQPQQIVLEITENLFIEDMNNVSKVVIDLRNRGFNISLDDFGTGYSSLSVLQKLPIDELKVDKSFVDYIDRDEKARKMIKNIIAIGKNYGMSVLAEGVESEHQMRMLQNFGCDYFQGYWFARPLAAEGLRRYVLQNNKQFNDAKPFNASQPFNDSPGSSSATAVPGSDPASDTQSDE